MTITIEDGTGVVNANSYIDLVDAVVLAENLGSPTPDMTEADLIKGIREVHKYAAQFSGTRTHPEQSELCDWPRTNATYYGELGVIAEDEIPSAVIQAQVLAAVDVHAGLKVSGINTGRSIASEAVSGAVSVSYFNNGSTSNSQRSEAVGEMLNPVLSSTTSQSGGGSGFGLPLRR